MEIVIDIPDILYKKIQDGKKVIVSGIKIPKEHSNLIVDDINFGNDFDICYDYSLPCDTINLAPIILQADTEKN